MLFKKSLLGLAVASAFVAAPTMASEGTTSPEYAEAANAFFTDSTVNGAVGVWMRNRTRAPGTSEGGNDESKVPNLDHGSLYFTVNYNSGYAGDMFGFDANVFATFDMWQNSNPDHEMNFWGVNNPYDMKPTAQSGCSGAWESDCNENGGQVQTAALKFKGGDVFNAKLGFFQPSVPTAIGVNWSFAAGTYTGGEVGLNFGDLALGVVYADEYRAPWFKDLYGFRTTDGKDAGAAYSIGGRYNFSDAISLDIAYAGLTDGDRSNFHVKYKHTTSNGWYLSPQLYVVDDNEQYDSTAFQVAFLSAKSVGPYSFRGEATYTAADSGNDVVGNMAYRLTSAYGGSNGTYDIWWNNRSDFNHDGEIGFFGSVARDMADLGAPGFNVGINGVYAFGAESSIAGVDELVEYSGSAFLNYAIQDGALEGANFGMYYTYYVNDSNAGNWAPYTNAFQDETDLKVTLVVPFTIK